MSGPFVNSNFFSPNRNETASAGMKSSSRYTSSYDSYGPMGLRQRQSANPNGSHDENTNPNNAPSDRSSSGKWGTTTNKNKVPAPPRVSLATAGRSAFRARSATATAQQQNPTENNSHSNVHEHALAIVPKEQKDNNDLSLWIVAYGFRTEDQFRALYNRLENCGKITSRCGGLSTLGERRKNDDDGKNWVALRYESSLLAHKALCQNGAFLNVGGSTIVIGVLPLAGSDAIVRLGINLSDATLSPLESFPKLRKSQFASDAQELITESDIMLNDGEKEGAADEGDAITSQLDSLCGKVLAWFFMWDVQN